MSTELQGQSPATSENEDWYDREIAPALAALARRCGDRGIGMLAVVAIFVGLEMMKPSAKEAETVKLASERAAKASAGSK